MKKKELARMERKNCQLYILLGGLISLVGLGATYLNEDDIIISLGISGTRILHIVLGVVGAVLVVGSSVSMLADYITRKIAEKEAKQEILEQMEKEASLQETNTTETQDKAILGVNKRFDPPKIRNVLEEHAKQESEGLKTLLFSIAKQMESMDGCQSKLHELLEMNSASKLKDSEDALDDAEQTICKHVRQIINMITAGAPKEDCIKIASDVFDSNKIILDKAGVFVVQLAKYLNSQGEAKEMTMLDSYHNAIDEVLKETK